MGATALNVTGDLVGTSVIAKSEGHSLAETPDEAGGQAAENG